MLDVFFRWLLCSASLCVLSTTVACAAPNTPAATLPEEQLAIGATTWGIVSYTRWPAEPNPLRVCVIGQTANTEAIQRLSDWVASERASTVRTLNTDENPANSCDVAYIGQVDPNTTARLVRQMTGRPILSIGENSDFCSAGGMFCLDPRQTGDDTVHFSVNLDAITRSGLRVNPQVLRLSRQLQKDH